MIEHSRPQFGKREKEAVLNSLEAGWTGEGPSARALVQELCTLTGAAGGITVGSATDGLHVALEALALDPDSQVLIPTYVCRDVLDAVLRANLRPLLCDVRAGDFNLDLSSQIPWESVDAAVVTHMFGFPVDPAPLAERGIPVIEDCAHAAGSLLAGKPAGSMGSISVFSLSAIKSLPGGEGGVVLSKDSSKVDALLSLKYGEGHVLRPCFRSRTSDLTAALALIQLNRLTDSVRERRELAQAFREGLSKLAVEFLEGMEPEREVTPCWHRFILKSKDPFPEGASRVVERFWEEGVRARLAVTPGPLHRLMGLDGHRFPIAEDLASRSLSLPFYPGLSDDEIQTLFRATEEIFEEMRPI